jgi:hypothetical protein
MEPGLSDAQSSIRCPLIAQDEFHQPDQRSIPALGLRAATEGNSAEKGWRWLFVARRGHAFSSLFMLVPAVPRFRPSANG